MRSLEGRTALVAGGDTMLGRAMALALSARGVRILVTGRDEKALGVTVGEVVHGGGKARHLAGEPRDPSHVAAALDRATAVFGSVDILIVAEPRHAECTFQAAVARVASPGRLLVAGTDAGDPAVAALVRDAVSDLAPRAITCNAIIVRDDEDETADGAADLAVYLCSGAAAGITGQAIEVRHAARTRPRA